MLSLKKNFKNRIMRLHYCFCNDTLYYVSFEIPTSIEGIFNFIKFISLGRISVRTVFSPKKALFEN